MRLRDSRCQFSGRLFCRGVPSGAIVLGVVLSLLLFGPLWTQSGAQEQTDPKELEAQLAAATGRVRLDLLLELTEAHGLLEGSADRDGLTEVLNNIGLVYWGLGQLDEALEYYHEALELQPPDGLDRLDPARDGGNDYLAKPVGKDELLARWALSGRSISCNRFEPTATGCPGFA